jgi:hypothetical protein
LVRDLKDGDIPVWFDEAELEPGDSIIQKIEAAIDRMDYLIVILSPASVSSGWVREELRMALHKGIAGRKFTVIPVLRAKCEIPGFLRDRKYVDMRPAADWSLKIPYKNSSMICSVSENVELSLLVSLELKRSGTLRIPSPWPNRPSAGI